MQWSPSTFFGDRKDSLRSLLLFFKDLDRQAGTANESYCEYAVERLETCIHSVSSLIYQLQSGPAHVIDHEAGVAARYSGQL